MSRITNLRCRAQSAMQSHVINLRISPAVQATRLLNPGRRGPAAAISNGASAQKAACVPCAEEHPGLAHAAMATICPAHSLPVLHEGKWASTSCWLISNTARSTEKYLQQVTGVSAAHRVRHIVAYYLGPQLHAAATAELPLPQECRLHPQPPCKPPGNRSERDRTGEVIRLGQHERVIQTMQGKESSLVMTAG